MACHQNIPSPIRAYADPKFSSSAAREAERRALQGSSQSAEKMDILCFVLSLPLVAGLDFSYHHTAELEAFLREVHRNHSSITHLYSIGKSVE
ncbi:UNVERIFIED_CONTAM: hypothetical protein K2H54_001006, partial [Gekko kuhli]